MSVQLLRRKFTVEQYQKMVESGIIAEGERVELIRGEIIQMAAIGRRHAASVNRLVRLFSQVIGDRAIISPQNPVQLDDNSVPQPDIALLHPRADFYEAGHPQPQDIFLLVEVADTTVEADREIKIPLYAEPGIIEIWLVDINAQCVEVYRQPTPTGYQSIQKFQRGQNLAIQAFLDINITIDQILG